MNWQPGDVVELKSGGPRMTVDNVEADDAVVCVWFEKSGEKKLGAFRSVMLQKPTSGFKVVGIRR
jgi:uncharacterized protein YodC (DUF2158 family)